MMGLIQQFKDMFFRFDTLPDCYRDGRTERQTDISMTAKTALCSVSRGKTLSMILKSRLQRG